VQVEDENAWYVFILPATTKSRWYMHLRWNGERSKFKHVSKKGAPDLRYDEVLNAADDAFARDMVKYSVPNRNERERWKICWRIDFRDA